MTLRILVADDDPLMRTLVAVCLRDIAQIVEAADGTETLSMMQETDFDLLLLDWNMPAPDGLAILTIVRSWGLRMPIVMITAEADRWQVLKAIHAGASDYLIKPFESTALREKVLKSCQPVVVEPVNS